MNRSRFAVPAVLVACMMAGCSSSDDGGGSTSSSSSSSSSSSGGDTEPDCTFVTIADIQTTASITTTLIPRDPSHGAGSTCNGNFAETKIAGGTEMVLLIDTIGRDQFDHPSDLMTQSYPNLEQPTDLGAGVEAKLFLGDQPDTGAKVLWMYKGDKGFELVSFFKLGDDPQLTKAQVLALGKIAATRF